MIASPDELQTFHELCYLTQFFFCHHVYEGTAILKAVETIPLGSQAIHK